VKPLILKENALKLLGLRSAKTSAPA
jgi:hypothetical protein